MVEINVLTNPGQSNQADTPVGTPSPSLDARVRVAVSQEPVTPRAVGDWGGTLGPLHFRFRGGPGGPALLDAQLFREEL